MIQRKLLDQGSSTVCSIDVKLAMARKKNKNKATKPKVGEKETDVRPSGEEKKEEDANNNQVQTFRHNENEKIGQGAVPKENEVVVSVEKTCSSKGSLVEEKNFE